MKIKGVLLITLIFLSINIANANNTFVVDNLLYRITNTSLNQVAVQASSKSIAGTITIPDVVENNNITYTVTMIETDGFRYCNNIEEVIIGNCITTIAPSAFANCTGLVKVTISNSVINVYGSIFENCTNLKTVILGNSITSIFQSMFRGCESLEEIDVNGSVTTIGSYAFYLCKNLKKVSLGESISTINEYSFGECNNLKEVIVKWEQPLNIPTSAPGNYAFPSSIFPDCILWVPANTASKYSNANVWKNFNIKESEPNGIQNKNDNLLEFSIYPNPISDYFMITNTLNANILVVNDLGQTIYVNNEYSSNEIINTSNWSKGLYIVHITQNNKSYSIKTIKN